MFGAGALAEIGALVGDPGRANMLSALLDGRALTAKELAARAGVAPQTASGHLAKLAAARLITVEKQGRHRYHRLASVEIARMLEAMMLIAAGVSEPVNSRSVRTGPRDLALRAARTCYDHLAGRLGVALADAMIARDLVCVEQGGSVVTGKGRALLQAFGIDMTAAANTRRPLCRPCLDWSERRPHFAGEVGARLMRRTFDLGWVRRLDGTRALMVTPAGRQGFHKAFGTPLDV